MTCDICHLSYPVDLPCVRMGEREVVCCMACLLFWCLAVMSGESDADIAQRTYDLTGSSPDPTDLWLAELPWPPVD